MTNWYDDIDAATLQRIKTYSAFCDYKSQNLMLQTLYEAMQKKIDENRGIAKDYADLQKQVKELKEGLAVGSTWNKALNSRNKYLEEERDKFRNMVFDKDEEACNSVLGNLTADNVFQRILSHWKGTKEKTSCRPFKSCNELVHYWERVKVGYSANPLQMIDIWVKHKVDGRRRMIVGFGDNFVEVGVKAKPVTLERLFEVYTFLDGEPCGVKEEKF